MYLFTKEFWNYALERAIKTVAQAAVAVITGEAFGLFDGDAWMNVASIAGMAGIVSILMSLQSYSAVNNDADMKALENTVKNIVRKAGVVATADSEIKQAAVNITSDTPATVTPPTVDYRG